MQTYNEEFKLDIEQLKNLYLVAKKTRHMFEFETDTWTLFEPSKFIYNYFAFNTFYNIDWIASMEKRSIIQHGKLEEKEKIKQLITFIFKTQEVSSISKVFFDEKQPVINERVLKECLKITVDRNGPNKNVSQKKKDNFIEQLSIWEKDKQIEFDSYYEIICFIYLVRNNIFHGSKTYRDMVDRDQRFRLSFYSKVLASTNQLLFDSITNAINYD